MHCIMDLQYAVLLLSATLQSNVALISYHSVPRYLTWPSHTKKVFLTRLCEQRNMHATRSTSDPDYEGGNHGIISAKNREHRRDRLHAELSKLGIDIEEIESNPERFGTSARTTVSYFPSHPVHWPWQNHQHVPRWWRTMYPS